MTDPVTTDIHLPVTTEHAFGLLTASLGEWWPEAYSWGPAVLDTHELEPVEGGRIAELSIHGNRYDWGRITTWNPPRRLVFDWQIGPGRVPTPDPAGCSEVAWSVAADGDGARVTVQHRGFDAYGDAAESYRDALASAQGWPLILAGLAAHLEGAETAGTGGPADG